MEIQLPQFFAGHIESHDAAALVVRDDMLAVSSRRGIAAGAVFVLAFLTFAKCFLPALASIEAVADNAVLAVDHAGDEDRVAPHGGRGAAWAGQLHLPRYALVRGKLDGVI